MVIGGTTLTAHVPIPERRHRVSATVVAGDGRRRRTARRSRGSERRLLLNFGVPLPPVLHGWQRVGRADRGQRGQLAEVISEVPLDV